MSFYMMCWLVFRELSDWTLRATGCRRGPQCRQASRQQTDAEARRLASLLDQNDRRLNVVTRSGRLYDKVEHTDESENDVVLDIVTLYAFEDLPPVFRRYVIYRAAGRAATQLVANPQLVQLLGTQEAQARAACLEYECEQGDHNFMGWPDGTTYRAYQPHYALRRS